MPVLSGRKLRLAPPKKNPRKLRIALSHEFVELYRGDKDLKIGKLLARDYNCEIMHLGTDIASPADSRIFGSPSYPVDRIGELPDDYHLLLMKSRLVFHRKGDIGMGGFFRLTPGIIPHLLRWKPDLILENPYLSLSPRSYMTFLASRLLGTPLVYLDCGDILADLKLKNRIVLPLEKRTVNRSSAVITYNNAGKKRFISKYGYDKDKIRVIPKPVDISRFIGEYDTTEFKSKHGLHGKFTVAYFGRLSANKGARYLLEAADIMRREGTDNEIVFLFVGGNLHTEQAGQFTTRLNELNLENVKVTGMIPNEQMPQAYKSVDLAVFPDVIHIPGFSTVLAESMAAGLPIIIGIKGHEDAVPIEDGKSGIVIKAQSPRQIADAVSLLKYYRELRNVIASNAHNFACEQMDYPRVVEKYYELFMELTGKQGREAIHNYDRSDKRERETVSY